MAQNQAAAAALLQQMPALIQKYRQGIDSLNNNILQIRQRIERTDISNEEREHLRVQEQEMQKRILGYQSILNNIIPHQLQQQQQAAFLRRQQQQQQQQQQLDNTGSSTPGSSTHFANAATNFASVQMRKCLYRQDLCF
jgi:hypothetical protein